MTNTALTLADINKALATLGLPTYQDVAFALCDVLDGDQLHDIMDLGLDQDAAQKVNDTRNSVKGMWLDHINGRD